VDYWLITTGPDGQPGINGGLLRRRGPAPAEGQPVNAYVLALPTALADAAVRLLDDEPAEQVIVRLAERGHQPPHQGAPGEGVHAGQHREDRLPFGFSGVHALTYHHRGGTKTAGASARPSRLNVTAALPRYQSYQ
jgi:hypothetical protein